MVSSAFVCDSCDSIPIISKFSAECFACCCLGYHLFVCLWLAAGRLGQTLFFIRWMKSWSNAHPSQKSSEVLSHWSRSQNFKCWLILSNQILCHHIHGLSRILCNVTTVLLFVSMWIYFVHVDADGDKSQQTAFSNYETKPVRNSLQLTF